jgi:hypothetical protein
MTGFEINNVRLKETYMADNFIKNAVLQAITEVQAWSQIAGDLSHQGEKGSAREDVLASFIKKFLPLNYDVGRGFVQDANGQMSTQIDIIIYNKFQTPRVGFGDDDGKFGIYPFESVRYAIEVKSTSTLDEIRKTNDNFKKLRNLKSNDPDNPWGIITVYFSFASDVKNVNECDRYIGLTEEAKFMPPIMVICCMNQGYWDFWQHQDEAPERCWNFGKSDGKGIELAMLLSYILRTLNEKDSLSYYVLPNDSLPYSYIWKAKPFEYEYMGEQLRLYNEVMVELDMDNHARVLELVPLLHPEPDRISLTYRSFAGLLYSEGKELESNRYLEEAKKALEPKE